jgi:hypothetical protein
MHPKISSGTAIQVSSNNLQRLYDGAFLNSVVRRLIGNKNKKYGNFEDTSWRLFGVNPIQASTT